MGNGEVRKSCRPPDSETLAGLLAFDAAYRPLCEGWIAGIDEAGRGPLAGPVVAAAAVIFRPEALGPVKDSKKLTPAKREVLYRNISENALIGIGVVGEEEIDRMNIYQATRLAMKKAVWDLAVTPGLLLIDGNMKLDLPVPQKTIIGGDRQSACIAAASIVAKVTRDIWMRHLDEVYPGYEFGVHKGYGTPRHMEFIQKLGFCFVHRKSFALIRWDREVESYEIL